MTVTCSSTIFFDSRFFFTFPKLTFADLFITFRFWPDICTTIFFYRNNIFTLLATDASLKMTATCSSTIFCDSRLFFTFPKLTFSDLFRTFLVWPDIRTTSVTRLSTNTDNYRSKPVDVTSSSLDFDVTSICRVPSRMYQSPVSAPWILDQPVWNIIFSAPSNNKDCMISLVVFTKDIRIYWLNAYYRYSWEGPFGAPHLSFNP